MLNPRTRRALLALTAVLVVGATGVASASAALPEMAAAKYPVQFSGSSGAFEMTTAPRPERRACESATIEGSFTGATTVTANMQFERCRETSNECKTKGVKAIDSETLTGTWGYLNKAKHEVELRFAGPKNVWAPEVLCDGYLGGELSGRLFGTVGAANTKTSKLSLTYNQTNGIQELRNFEGNPIGQGGQLYWGEFQMGFAPHFTLSTSEPVELKA